MPIPTRDEFERWRREARVFRHRGHAIAYRCEGSGPALLAVHGLPSAAWDWHAMYGACHMHDHFVGFANYRLLDGLGGVVATGHKQSFALSDLMQFLDDAGPGQYPLFDGTQGISVGWADVYNAQLDCQWIDITDVAPGDYQLEIEINFDQLIVESDYVNNLIVVDVTIDESDPPPPVIPDEWTCLPAWYDGCDCGCGGFDPDCANPTVDACEYCGEDGSCAPGDFDCSEIQPANNALCI